MRTKWWNRAVLGLLSFVITLPAFALPGPTVSVPEGGPWAAYVIVSGGVMLAGMFLVRRRNSTRGFRG
jgi:uncharacterized membrane protein HdeD (DUF308 family)